MYKFIPILLFVLPFVASAGTVSGKIHSINIHLDNWNTVDLSQNGVFMFTIESLPGACDSGQRRIAIKTNHPLYDTIVSTVLSAQAQSKPVTVNYLEQCTFRGSAWDFGTLYFES